MSELLSVNTFYNLEDLLSPLYYGDEVKIPPVPPGTPSVPGGIYTKGRISQDCQWGYSYNGSVIRCFPINTSSSSASNLVLGRSCQVPSVIHSVGYHFPGSIIKCDAELKVHNQKGLRKLLLGLDCGTSGALVIFDPIKGQPLKWINLPAPATAVTVLSHFERDGCTRPFLSESVMAMVGVAAVGLVGGQFLIVDLGLDEKERRSTNSSGYTLFDQSSDNFYNLYCVDPHEEYIVSKRRTAISQKLMICLELNYQEQPAEDHQFYYLDQFGNELGSLTKHEVHITCIEYVPVIESIVIGYNFGGFQIWKFDNFRLEYSSAFNTNKDTLPVLSFLFQQPIDDPRNYCYLWVVYGVSSAEVSPARVELYALIYADQEFMDPDNSGPVYSDLQNCHKRLYFHLQDCYSEIDPEESVLEGTSMRYLVRPLRMWTHEDCLVFISWESSREGVSYLGVFDLNQWYSAQTPDSFPLSGENLLNPFWCAISFGNPGLCSQIWDIRIIPRTLEKWINPHVRDEIHLFPASLTFQAVCLSSTGVYTFEHFGIQEKLFRLIQKDGYSMMAEPGRLRELCQNVGLSKYYSPAYEDEFTEAELDQIFVLTVLLESRRPSLIVQFASKWLDGSYQNLGCGVNLILRWVISFTATIRSAANPHWLMMLSHRMDELPPETFHFIHYSNFVWTQLKSLMWTILRPLSPAQLEEYSDINFALEKLVQYSATLLMLHRAGLLPVSPSFLFMNTLKIYYEERRASVRAAFDRCPYLQGEELLVHPLLVDYLFENLDEEFLCEEWDVSPGQPFYPPRDPGLIINLFLGSWVHIPSKIISRIIFYFMLDLMQYPENRIDLRGDFSSIISLTPEEQTHVAILWMVDHCEFPEAIAQLPKIPIDDEKDGLPWSAAMVILAAQGQEKPVCNILREHSFPSKIGKFAFRLVCTLEPERTDAISGLISRFSTNERLIDQLLHIAESRNILDSLLVTGLSQCSDLVLTAVENFFRGLSPTFRNRIRLLNFYIRKDKFAQAVEHYKIMIQQFRDRKMLDSSELLAWETAEVNLKKLMIASCGTCSADSAARTIQSSRAQARPITVRVTQIPNTPEPSYVSHGLNAIPTQIRLLMKDGMETRPGQTVFSPLRRYTGRIHKEASPVEANNTTMSRLNSTAFPPGTPENNLNKSRRLSVDFHSLLKSPRVTHGRLSDEDYTSPVLFGTPASNGIGSSAESRKSSMKKQDNSLRKHVLLKTRFLDIPSSPDEEQQDNAGTEIPNARTEAPATTTRSVSPRPSSPSSDLPADIHTGEESEEMQIDENDNMDESIEYGVENSFAEPNIELNTEPNINCSRSASPEMPQTSEEVAEYGVEDNLTEDEEDLQPEDAPALPIDEQVPDPFVPELEAEEVSKPVVIVSGLSRSASPERPKRKRELSRSPSPVTYKKIDVSILSTSEGVLKEPVSIRRLSPLPIPTPSVDVTEEDEAVTEESETPVDQAPNVTLTDPKVTEIQDEYFEATAELPVRRKRRRSSKSLRAASPGLRVVAPVRSRSVPKSIGPNVPNLNISVPPSSSLSAGIQTGDESEQMQIDEEYNMDTSIDTGIGKPLAEPIIESISEPEPTAYRSRSASPEIPHASEDVAENVTEESQSSADQNVEAVDHVLDETKDECIELTTELPLRRQRRGSSKSLRTPSPGLQVVTPVRSRSVPKSMEPNAPNLNESVLSTPPIYRRSTRSMSRQREDDDSLVDDSFNQSSDASLLDVSVDVPKRRLSRSKKSPSVSPSRSLPVAGPSTSTGTRSRSRRTSASLNESVLETPPGPPLRRPTTRSMSRQSQDGDADESLIDESMNKSGDSIIEGSMEAPKRPPPKSRRSTTPKKGRAASEPRTSSGSWSIFDQGHSLGSPTKSGSDINIKPLTRSITRLLEQSDAEATSDDSILEASIDEPKSKKRDPTRKRAKSEPKTVPSRAPKRSRTPSSKSKHDEEEEERSTMRKRLLRNFRNYELDLSTVNEESLPSPSP